MKRDLERFSNKQYDLCVIGGGIYGACVAWDAVLRGLSVALIEKSDFASGTSANSLKIIHGGLRYLQHADFRRMRESIREQKILMKLSPNLVHPLPVLIPTYGFGLRGKWAMFLALAANDLIGFDRNKSIDSQKELCRGHVISKEDCLHRLPGIDHKGLTGGAIFYDAQVYNSERLPLSFLFSASERGADIANYTEVTGFVRDKKKITGLEVKDLNTGESFTISSKAVVNTTGPWVNRILSFLKGEKPKDKICFAKAINLITTRPIFQKYAVGLSARTRYHDTDAIINKGSRLFFVTPWRGTSLIGTAYAPYEGAPDDFSITAEEVEEFLEEFNQACPSARLKSEDVSFVHGGLLPREGLSKVGGDVQLTKDYRIYDHENDGFKGLLSVVGVKYTTARSVAEKTVDQVVEILGQKTVPSLSAVTPLHDGKINHFDDYLASAVQTYDPVLKKDTISPLVYNYGSSYADVLQSLPPNWRDSEIGAVDMLKAETLHGIRREMAIKLSDIVFRRTELGTKGHPGSEKLQFCAEVMGAELSWSESKLDQELQEVESYFFKPGHVDVGIHGDSDVRADLATSAVQ